LLFSTYLPGHFALGPQSSVYVGETIYPKPPKIAAVDVVASYQTSVLIEKLDATATRAAVVDNITPVDPSGDQLIQSYGVAPGEMVRIVGRGLGPATAAGAQLDAKGRVSTSLSGTRVLFDGVPGPLFSVQDKSILVITPFALTGPNTNVQVEMNGVAMPGVSAGIVNTAPSLLAVVNPDGTLNSKSNPAHQGQILILYVSGFGNTNPSVPDGSIYQRPLPVPLLSLTAGPTTLLYAGPAPGLAAGIWQVNVMAPSAGGPTDPAVITLTTLISLSGYYPRLTVPVWVVA
jgi:uncharacterized protein (TIGR03437 family)